MKEQDDLLRYFNLKEESAYFQLFRQYYSYLVLFAKRRVENIRVAEDIVQEVFIHLWESNKQYDSLSGLKVYLYESVANRCTDYWKHRTVEEKYITYALYEQQQPDFSILQEEVYRELYIAISELPVRNREVILLYLEGKKNQEIARLLNLSILTVKTHKRNALRFLRQRLGNLFMLIIILKLKEKNVLSRMAGMAVFHDRT